MFNFKEDILKFKIQINSKQSISKAENNLYFSQQKRSRIFFFIFLNAFDNILLNSIRANLIGQLKLN